MTAPEKPPTEAERRAAKLASALRANLRRRKSAPPAKPAMQPKEPG